MTSEDIKHQLIIIITKIYSARAATSMIFVTTKHVFCHDKSMLVTTKVCFPRQNYCRDKHIFVTTKLLSRQIFVATNIICRDKTVVATSLLLSRQTRVCREKNTCFTATKVCLSRQTRICRDKIMFVVTKRLSYISLSQQNFCHGIHTRVCRDKNDTYGNSRK